MRLDNANTYWSQRVGTLARYMLVLATLLLCILLTLGVLMISYAPSLQRPYIAQVGSALISGVVIAGAIFVAEWARESWHSIRSSQQALLMQIAVNQDLAGIDLRGRNLSGTYLRYKNLTNALLIGADLRNADLTGCVLKGAQLGRADLRGARLRAADLRLAVLSGARLDGADMGFCDARGAALSNVGMHRVIAPGANFSALMPADVQELLDDGVNYLSMSPAEAIRIGHHSNIARTEFSNVRACCGSWGGSTFVGARIDDTDFSFGVFSYLGDSEALSPLRVGVKEVGMLTWTRHIKCGQWSHTHHSAMSPAAFTFSLLEGVRMNYCYLEGLDATEVTLSGRLELRGSKGRVKYPWRAKSH
jgi:uncharacterized protein YjbI with pentapeptide repeats